MILNNSKDFELYMERRTGKTKSKKKPEDLNPVKFGGDFDLEDLRPPMDGHTVSGDSPSRPGRDSNRNHPTDKNAIQLSGLVRNLEDIIENEIAAISRDQPVLGTHNKNDDKKKETKSAKQRKRQTPRGQKDIAQEVDTGIEQLQKDLDQIQKQKQAAQDNQVKPPQTMPAPRSGITNMDQSHTGRSV